MNDTYDDAAVSAAFDVAAAAAAVSADVDAAAAEDCHPTR